MFWIPRSTLKPLGMPSKFCGGKCGSVKLGLPGNSSTDGVYNLDQINVADGHDVCHVCDCDLAYVAIAQASTRPWDSPAGLDACPNLPPHTTTRTQSHPIRVPPSGRTAAAR